MTMKLIVSSRSSTCPHCHVVNPHLIEIWQQPAITDGRIQENTWTAFFCNHCDGIISKLNFEKRQIL